MRVSKRQGALLDHGAADITFLSSVEEIVEDARNGRMSSWSTTRTARTRAISSSPRRWRRPRRSTSWRATGAA